jgi:hypothetical protein
MDNISNCTCLNFCSSCCVFLRWGSNVGFLRFWPPFSCTFFSLSEEIFRSTTKRPKRLWKEKTIFSLLVAHYLSSRPVLTVDHGSVGSKKPSWFFSPAYNFVATNVSSWVYVYVDWCDWLIFSFSWLYHVWEGSTTRKRFLLERPLSLSPLLRKSEAKRRTDFLLLFFFNHPLQ